MRIWVKKHTVLLWVIAVLLVLIGVFIKLSFFGDQ
jgi:cytochrome c-type biogenesis protein CcmH/NrfF